MSWRSLEDVFEEFDRDDRAGFGVFTHADIERRSNQTPPERYANAPEGLSRNEKIVWYRSHGWDLNEIAEVFGISRQRAHQICKRDALRKEVIPE